MSPRFSRAARSRWITSPSTWRMASSSSRRPLRLRQVHLLRMVAGLEDVTSGTIAHRREIVNDLPPEDRDVAMVFQNYALYPHMTVAENLGFSLRIKRESKEHIHERVAEVSHVLGLQPFLGRKPKALSGGQRQRVAMGRAIVRHPRVFLMDEPLSNLDAKLRVAMRGELTRLHHRYETTTLYVTHDQVEAMTLGNRIAVLDAGRLQQVGGPQELYDSPRNVFVAGFIGSPAMNLAPAHLMSTADGLTLVLGDHRWPLPPSVWPCGRNCARTPARTSSSACARTTSPSRTAPSNPTAPACGCTSSRSRRWAASAMCCSCRASPARPARCGDRRRAPRGRRGRRVLDRAGRGDRRRPGRTRVGVGGRPAARVLLRRRDGRGDPDDGGTGLRHEFLLGTHGP